jgi:hypothetical protein
VRGKYQLVAILLIWASFFQQDREKKSRMAPEQTVFSVELEVVPVARPTNLSEAAIHALAKDSAVSSCLGEENSSRHLPPNSWFLASEIHLARADMTDLVVMPGEVPAAEAGPAPNACFLGPYTSKWWILRKVAEGYEVVLTVDAHDIEVTRTKRNGYRDIEAGITSMQGTTVTTYRFDGHRYRRDSEKQSH